MRRLNNIAVTGGAGFIGSNFIHYIFESTNFKGNIINVDKLTYAGNPENLASIESAFGGTRYFFENSDIGNFNEMSALFKKYDIDTMVHFAAESHVDRSIHGPAEFITTNIVGTFNLLEVARNLWPGREDVLFHHVSTDEVYGSLAEGQYFFETSPYDPQSPYSASKAASDHLVKAYKNTYGIPFTLSNCSNNYGPYQFPEKLIPLMLLNLMNDKPLPVYGDGRNVRDWLYVLDHAEAIWFILNKGRTGESYNIGGENDEENLAIVNLLCQKMAEKTGQPVSHYTSLITFVKDRPGHDRRYAINCDKIKKELGWKQQVTLSRGLDLTIEWYSSNRDWVDHVTSGEYRHWMDRNYGNR
ncbi:MAG: dTDP-glucose 4,6-dehydratase [Spirochaetales bacterium]|nr:dTDP-glucose 4,6-dehydratase [Spirochaetales bacterium]